MENSISRPELLKNIQVGQNIVYGVFSFWKWATERPELWDDLIRGNLDQSGSVLLQCPDCAYSFKDKSVEVLSHIETIGISLLKIYRFEMFRSYDRSDIIEMDHGYVFPINESAKLLAQKRIESVDRELEGNPESFSLLEDNTFLFALDHSKKELDEVFGLTLSQKIRARRLYRAIMICWRAAMSLQVTHTDELLNHLKASDTEEAVTEVVNETLRQYVKLILQY